MFLHELPSHVEAEDGGVGRVHPELGGDRSGPQIDPHIGKEIALALNGNADGRAGSRRPDGVQLNGELRKIRIALVHGLEETHLGSSSQKCVLSALSNEIYQSSRHVFTIGY